MKNKFPLANLALVSLFLVLAPAAMAATTWYVRWRKRKRQERLQDASDCLQDNQACHLANFVG